MLVQREIYNKAIETARAVAESIKIKSAELDGPHMGPLVSKKQFDKVQNYIKKGIDEGAKLVTGGPGYPEGISRGYFVKPTVFADVSNNMAIAKDEIFGPVLTIMPFDNEEEAVKITNDTSYGLSNYVQSQNHLFFDKLV